MATEMGVRAVNIILSGYDGDGTEGCKHIKGNGGKTFTQELLLVNSSPSANGYPGHPGRQTEKAGAGQSR